jgi:hypothetical protein
MKGIVGKAVFMAPLLLLAAAACHCEGVTVDELIKGYNKATDLERSSIMNGHQYKPLSVKGVIENVESWDAFDERTQTKARYYRVTTERQRLDPENTYIVSIFYNDIAKVEKLSKGQAIDVEGSLIKILATPGLFSIWVYAGEMTAEDKVMLEQGRDL